MHRNLLRQALSEYAMSALMLPEETASLERITHFINAHADCFERARSGHITSSAWVVNHEGTHALLTHHRKFNIWLQLGGHNDGDHDCACVALKEAHEESGIEQLVLYKPGIFDIDVHELPNACAYHYDIRYVIQAPAGARYIVSEESHALAWVPIDKIPLYSPHRSVIRMQEKWLRFFQKLSIKEGSAV
jgi:ADP-ribose pyrophosphatase YjhB (NUDIX family)